MPLLGAHISIAGGLEKAFDRLESLGAEALQIFTANQRQWQTRAVHPEAAETFRRKWELLGKPPIAAHGSYLVNLAVPDGEILKRSIGAFSDELRRADTLGISYLIMHPGCHLGQGIRQGLAHFTKNLDIAIDLSETDNVAVLLENTAGQGTCLGSTFEEIATVLAHSRHNSRLGVCFDTCHAYCAGYDFRDMETYDRSFSDFDEIIGLERLKFFHLNDSKRELGSRVDRHEHIGQGTIGLEAFRLVLNDFRFAHHPMVIETPKEEGLAKDLENLAILRTLLDNTVR
jgi:deoxyribonuclease-4